jgi:hypothetical protein
MSRSAGQAGVAEVLAQRLLDLSRARPRRWVAAAWCTADDQYLRRVEESAPANTSVTTAVNDYLHARDILIARWPGSETRGRATWGSTSHEHGRLTLPRWVSHAWWQLAGFVGAKRYPVRPPPAA